MQRGQGGGRARDLREVECYTCHKKGHLSCYCPQHVWNKPNNWTPCPTQGREAVMDNRSVAGEEIRESGTAMPQQTANAWLQSIANEGEEVRDLVMRDLLRKEDFPSA